MKVSAVALAYPTLVHVSSCPHHIPRVIPLVPISLSPFHQYPSPILIHLLCNCTPLPAVQYSTVKVLSIQYPLSTILSAAAYNLQSKPYSRGTLESTSESNLHNPISLPQWVTLLLFHNVFHFIPDGRRRGVSIVEESHAGWFRVMFSKLHILFNACQYELS